VGYVVDVWKRGIPFLFLHIFFECLVSMFNLPRVATVVEWLSSPFFWLLLGLHITIFSSWFSLDFSTLFIDRNGS
jgi:hypothetical protein